jgi:hypothetical protein
MVPDIYMLGALMQLGVLYHIVTVAFPPNLTRTVTMYDFAGRLAAHKTHLTTARRPLKAAKLVSAHVNSTGVSESHCFLLSACRCVVCHWQHERQLAHAFKWWWLPAKTIELDL